MSSRFFEKDHMQIHDVLIILKALLSDIIGE